MPSLRPSLLDRLLGAHTPHSGAQQLHTPARIRQGVARDLEVLLNTRRGLHAQVLAPYPLSAASVLGFGLDDFVSLTLLSPHDRQNICRAIEQGVSAHEPRLTEVRVHLEVDRSTPHALRFVINAVLRVHDILDAVNFDAELSTMTQQYAVHSQSRVREAVSANGR